ncbi:MAG TPA: PepSY domain-containing protein [Burkholderiaceae bacterium]
MKALIAILATCIAGSAFAHGNVSCPVLPKEEKQPQMALQKKLEAEGWKVRQVKNYNGCYEVYGFDSKGAKAEAFFHPKTFERVYPEDEKAAGPK